MRARDAEVLAQEAGPVEAQAEAAAAAAPPCPSWRARKKDATRKAIGVAALQLALERGLDNVRVAEIAERAGVSPRTYNNYFSSREEAICSLAAERAWRTVAVLRTRPPSEPLAEALEKAIIGEGTSPQPDKAMLRFIFCDPSLRSAFLRATEGVHHQLAEAITERAGGRAGRDLLPAVVAAAYLAGWRTGMMFWLNDRSSEPLQSVLSRTFAALAPVAASLGDYRSGRAVRAARPNRRS